MVLRALQRAGHQPIVLVGGATGLIGDPRPIVRAAAQRQGDGGRLGGADPPPGRAVPRPAGRAGRPARPDLRRQPRLDGAAVGDRLPARPRQALPGQPDAGQGGGVGAAELRRRHQLHRVQLPDPAGQRLPRAVPPARLHAAERRLRPVGQHHRRRRPGPPHGGRGGARAGHAADHHVRRQEDRQDRGRHRLARPGAHQPLRVLPVLAQHRRRRRPRLAAAVLRAAGRGDRGADRREPRAPGRAGGAAGARRGADPAGARRRGAAPGRGGRPGPVRPGRPGHAGGRDAGCRAAGGRQRHRRRRRAHRRPAAAADRPGRQPVGGPPHGEGGRRLPEQRAGHRRRRRARARTPGCRAAGSCCAGASGRSPASSAARAGA